MKEIDLLKKLHESGVSIEEIAVGVGMNYYTVWRWIKKKHVPKNRTIIEKIREYVEGEK